ncbi:MAG: hypothetical protein ACKPKO_62965, partial [Candidatus Fonsibacter sp.]
IQRHYVHAKSLTYVAYRSRPREQFQHSQYIYIYVFDYNVALDIPSYKLCICASMLKQGAGQCSGCMMKCNGTRRSVSKEPS